MNDLKGDADELIAIFDEMLFSLIESMQANDWVEAGRINAAFRGLAVTLGDANLWQPVFPMSNIWYVPLISPPKHVS